MKGLRFYLAGVPALLVTGVTLFFLLAAVSNAAIVSQPGDLLYALRAPALQLQLSLTNDPAARQILEQQPAPLPENLLLAPPAIQPTTIQEPTRNSAPAIRAEDPPTNPVHANQNPSEDKSKPKLDDNPKDKNSAPSSPTSDDDDDEPGDDKGGDHTGDDNTNGDDKGRDDESGSGKSGSGKSGSGKSGSGKGGEGK
jgi:uncharacterized membrane protein YgcG